MSFLSSLQEKTSNCSGCQARKEKVKEMLTDHKFWMGVVVGVAGVYVYKKFSAKAM